MSMWNNQAGGPPPSARFTGLLDQLRTEFSQAVERAEHNDAQANNHLREMDGIRHKLWEFEQTQGQMKKVYEDEIAHLRRQLETRGGPHSLAGQPPPPQVGHGTTNHFSGIMAGGGSGALPPSEPTGQPMGPGAHGGPGGPGGPAPLGPGPQGPMPQPSFYPNSNGYPPQPPQPTQSPGPSGRGGRPPRGPPGPATPQQNTAAPYPGSPHVARPTPPPGQIGSHMGISRVGNTLGDLELDQLLPHHKQESPPGQDWFVVYNPNVRRELEIELVHTFTHQSVVCCVRFSLDGRYVATGCNRLAQIYDVHTGATVATLQDMTSKDDSDLYIRSVCFSPDGKYLATGAEDKVIRVWDIASSRIVNSFTGHEQDIYSLDYSRNGRYIASGSGDHTVRLWDLDSGRQISSFLIDDGVTTVAISPNNAFLAAGSLDKSVRVWDMGGTLIERLEGDFGHRDSVYSVAFSPDTSSLVSGSLDKTIKMWDLRDITSRGGPRIAQSARCSRTFEGHKDFVLSVALTTDNRWVLSGSKDRGVQFWDPATGNAQLMLQGHKNSVISVAPNPVGDLFATGSGDLKARIWRYKPWNGPQ